MASRQTATASVVLAAATAVAVEAATSMAAVVEAGSSLDSWAAAARAAVGRRR